MMFPNLASYKDYIRGFTWNTMKYSTKRSLLELHALITKVKYLKCLLILHYVEHAAKWRTNKKESRGIIGPKIENRREYKEGSR